MFNSNKSSFIDFNPGQNMIYKKISAETFEKL